MKEGKKERSIEGGREREGTEREDALHHDYGMKV